MYLVMYICTYYQQTNLQTKVIQEIVSTEVSKLNPAVRKKTRISNEVFFRKKTG